MRKFFKEWGHRLMAPTPAFFNKLAAAGAGLIALGGIVNAPELLALKVHMPDVLVKISGYAITAGTILTLAAKSACKQTPNIP